MTSGSRVPASLGNSKREAPKKHWCFTLNNYTDEELHCLRSGIQGKYIIGYEIAPTTGTPHLQGHVRFNDKLRFAQVKEMFSERIHWEPANNPAKSMLYCKKGGKFDSTFPEDLAKNYQNELRDIYMAEYAKVEWIDWQQQIIDIIEGPIDRRKIHWIWEQDGNRGKSFLADYIALKYDSIIVDGCRTNTFHQVLKTFEEGKRPNSVILDIPKASEQEHPINYGLLEKLKGKIIFSGKYEGGRIIIPPWHLLVFANQPPNFKKMGADRFNVIDLNDDSDTEDEID